MTRKTISYKMAVKKIADMGEILGISGFDQSSFLASMFDMQKEQTMNDLIDYKRKKFGIKTKYKRG